MIFRLHNLIPHKSVGTQAPSGMWVRAVHEPFRGGLFDRLSDAWAVLKGNDVFAVRWPKAGEFEQAIVMSEREP